MSDVRNAWEDFGKVRLPLLERLGSPRAPVLETLAGRRTIAALESLNDDTLMDIGIARADIPAMALRVTSPGPRHRVAPSARPAPIKRTNR